MEKLTVFLIVLLLSGCSLFSTTLHDPVCADKVVYKRYDVEMPIRPKLEIEKTDNTFTTGSIVRAYEIDLTNMMEYSMKLENILKPIVVEEGSYNLEPTPELPPDKPWYQFW